jgi:hypothetical protein
VAETKEEEDRFVIRDIIPGEYFAEEHWEEAMGVEMRAGKG